MVVYVTNKYGQPLMPTNRFGKVRHLLEDGKAKVVKRCPFTIQLLYDSANYAQAVKGGVDPGDTTGLSASTEEQQLFAAKVERRKDIPKLLETKREFRRARRNRKTRYRKCRHDNRVRKGDNRYTPSANQFINSIIKAVDIMCELVPIDEIAIEAASFDLQLLKTQLEGSPSPEGVDYQNGTLKDWNIREYVFARDNYQCQWCKGKSGDKIFHTHHWNYWRGDHTNKPESLITLCSTCNDSKYHKQDANRLWGWEPLITNDFKAAALLNAVRYELVRRLKAKYPNVKVTFGHITKHTRIENNLSKDHDIDALCIAGTPKAKLSDDVYIFKSIRCHNRQIHKATISKGGKRKLNQSATVIKGFKLLDKVSFDNQECFIFGKRTSGYFDLRLIDGTKIHASASFKKLKLLERKKSFLIECRKRKKNLTTFNNGGEMCSSHD